MIERGEKYFLQPIYGASETWFNLSDGEMTVTYGDGRTEKHRVESVEFVPKRMSIHVNKDGLMEAFGEIKI